MKEFLTRECLTNERVTTEFLTTEHLTKALLTTERLTKFNERLTNERLTKERLTNKRTSRWHPGQSLSLKSREIPAGSMQTDPVNARRPRFFQCLRWIDTRTLSTRSSIASHCKSSLTICPNKTERQIDKSLREAGPPLCTAVLHIAPGDGARNLWEFLFLYL